MSLHGQLGQLLKVQNREMSLGKPSAFELANNSQSVMPEPEKALFMAFACGMDVKFHVDNGCLKLLALRNMFFMSVTADMSQVLRGWSKDEAAKNMPLMLVDISGGATLTRCLNWPLPGHHCQNQPPPEPQHPYQEPSAAIHGRSTAEDTESERH